MAGQEGVARFGVFEVDMATGELRRRGLKLAIPAQPFGVLSVLLEVPGRLVTRATLRARIWPDAVHLDFEHGLNKAVHRLRQVLGDSTASPRFVETLPRRGYRFIAPVEVADRSTSVPPPARSRLRVVWGSHTFPLREGDNIVGRDEGTDVLVDSATVSRRHARIVVEGESATVEDLGSKNGTFLDGERLTARAPLVDGTELRVGSERLVFRSSATGSTPTASLDEAP